jgi:HAD superfamily phosphatase (TIGR01668 family)
VFLNKLIPDHFVDSVYHLDLAELKFRGVKGIITDLDNTLIEWDRPAATPQLIEWLQSLKQHGFEVIVVSNNNHVRVAAFCKPLGIPYIHAARKPRRAPFREAVKQLNLEGKDIVVIGDQLFTDVLGGNRQGLYTILVVPVSQTDGFFTRINRRLERMALFWMKKKGMIHWEDN